MQENHPEAIKAFLRAFNKAVKETLADPAAAVQYVKAQDSLINTQLETRRLQMAFDQLVVTPESKKIGLGDVDPARMQRSITEVVEAFGLKNTPDMSDIFTSAFLPPRAERDVP